MLKRFIGLSSAVFLLLFNAHAQEKMEKFCQVKYSGGKHPFAISFGQEDSLFAFKDSSVLINLKKVETLKTETDMMNYMASLNWTLVTLIPFGPYTSQECFYYKKSFDKSEITNHNNGVYANKNLY